jgi:hypothetical protein
MSGNVGIGFDGGTVASTANPFPIKDTPQTSGGYTAARVQSAATTNATSVKVSAAQVYSIAVGNNGASAAYLKLYNKTSAPIVGTDTPVATYLVPVGGNFVTSFRSGKPFAVGIAYAITGAAADSDTTAVAANQVTGSIEYA